MFAQRLKAVQGGFQGSPPLGDGSCWRGRSRWPRVAGLMGLAGGTGLSHAVLCLTLPAQHILDRAQTITVPHLCNVLLALAHLNFRPEREDQFFSLVQSVHPCSPILVPLCAGCCWAPGEQLWAGLLLEGRGGARGAG